MKEDHDDLRNQYDNSKSSGRAQREVELVARDRGKMLPPLCHGPDNTSTVRLSDVFDLKVVKAPIGGGVLRLFPRAMHVLAQVSRAGAKKYGVKIDSAAYLEVPDAYEVYTDALARHLVDEKLEGPVNHKDGGLLHPAQAAWSALARLEIFLAQAEKPHDKTE